MRGEPVWELRVGINTGPVIAGVVGKNKFAYDIWGDTVNVASRMESGGENGRINISGDTQEFISNYFDCEYRGKLPAKNKGEVEMFFVNAIKAQFCQKGETNIPNEGFIKLIRDMG
jgi:class 3 adenylate cyclase